MKSLIIIALAFSASVYAKDFTVKKELAESLYLSLEQVVAPECKNKKCEIALDQLVCVEIFKKTRCTLGIFSNGKVQIEYIKGQEAVDISDALYDIRDANCSKDSKACGSHFYDIQCQEEKKLFFKSYKCHLSDIK